MVRIALKFAGLYTVAIVGLGLTAPLIGAYPAAFLFTACVVYGTVKIGESLAE